MAYWIKIEKTNEGGDEVIYRFTSDGGNSGVFEINKESGEFSLLEPMPGDDEQNIYRRASIKILREWKSGSLPDVTEWAS